MTAEKRPIVGQIAGGIFLSEEFSKEIIHIAEALTKEPVVRASGFHRPFIPLWIAYTQRGMPRGFLEIFFDEFENARFEPLEFSGGLGILENGIICAVFKQNKMINVIKDEVMRVSRRCCDEVVTVVAWEDIWTPFVFLGYGCKEAPSLPLNVTVPYKKMFPERIAVGRFTKNYGFKTVMERSNKGR